MSRGTKLIDWGNKNIRIPIKQGEHLVVFSKLCIDPEKSNLMDVKKSIFKIYGRVAEITIQNSRKTIAQQKPDNAYSVPITQAECDFFMSKFGLNLDDYSSDLNNRILEDIRNQESLVK